MPACLLRPHNLWFRFYYDLWILSFASFKTIYNKHYNCLWHSKPTNQSWSKERDLAGAKQMTLTLCVCCFFYFGDHLIIIVFTTHLKLEVDSVTHSIDCEVRRMNYGRREQARRTKNWKTKRKKESGKKKRKNKTTVTTTTFTQLHLWSASWLQQWCPYWCHRWTRRRLKLTFYNTRKCYVVQRSMRWIKDTDIDNERRSVDLTGDKYD